MMVAAANGHVLGGGFVLLLCADYRLAAGAAGTGYALSEARARELAQQPGFAAVKAQVRGALIPTPRNREGQPA